MPENAPPVRSRRTKGVFLLNRAIGGVIGGGIASRQLATCCRHPTVRRSTIRQFVAWRSVTWRSVIGRDGDEACITDHVDQNFQPHGHDAPFPVTATPQGPCLFLRYAIDQTRPIAWLAITCGRRLSVVQMKTPPASEDADGVFRAFTSRKVAALKRKTSRHRLRSRHCGILSVEFSCVPPGALRRR